MQATGLNMLNDKIKIVRLGKAWNGTECCNLQVAIVNNAFGNGYSHRQTLVAELCEEQSPKGT